MSAVLSGLDVARRDGLRLPGAGRVGLLCNNATVDRELNSTVRVLRSLPGVRLERLFSPQHGFAGEKQDNMVESADGVHPESGLPVYSLYGRVRRPDPGMLQGLDALVIDLPDVGTRVYTFISTAVHCLEVCAQIGLPVVVLDRANPIGGAAVEGPLLLPAFASFVGVLPVPLRHGLTLGESCLLARAHLDLDLELRVMKVEGWRRSAMLPETGFPWVMPSPNLPTWEGALVYPGMVMLEGTNLSEGRGTTRPFEIWGAPWLRPEWIQEEIGPQSLPGCVLRQIAFEPTFHKYQGQTVRGFQIHVTETDRYRPVRTAVALLAACRKRHPGEFRWKEPPYEYETERLPIDLIAGTDELRLALDGTGDLDAASRRWESEAREFVETRRPFLLYA